MAHDILIVDDERDICTLIAGILEDEGHTARRAHNSTEAIEAVRQRRPALVILDVWLQGSELDGLQILEVIRREDPPIPVVMISGHGTIDTAVSAIKSGAYDFVEKPFKADRLLLVVDRAIEADKLKRENVALRRRAGGEVTFVGSSSDAANVRAQIEKVAPTGSRVLVTGASGSGKETVARLIHQGSKRADGPFVVVNCSTLPAERLEIELFGTDGDTDAEALRVSGAFEMAHGGTLVLKEVADLPLALQGRLARVLHEQSYARDGGKTKVEIDVRVLATTARDLQEESAGGRFREDLFYRLNVVPIELPPLRERREVMVDDYWVEEVPFANEPTLEDAKQHVLAGEPEQVTEKLVRILKEIRPSHMTFYFQVGDIPLKQALESMRLFVEEVIPGVEKAFGMPIAEINRPKPLVAAARAAAE